MKAPSKPARVAAVRHYTNFSGDFAECVVLYEVMLTSPDAVTLEDLLEEINTVIWSPFDGVPHKEMLDGMECLALSIDGCFEEWAEVQK
jgi:hypothetical protein